MLYSMSANWRTTWLEQTGIPERKAQLENRSHGQEAMIAFTEENNGNSEHSQDQFITLVFYKIRGAR